MPRVRQHLKDERLSLRVKQRRDRPVEIGRDPVAHVRLDQSLQPVGWRRPGVERIHRLHERLHCRARIGLQLLQPPPQLLEVAELGDGHPGQGGLVRQRLGKRRVLRQPEERAQRRISQ